MHWADLKSIELIDKFFSHNNSQRFYLILGYRPEEIKGYSPLDEFLKKFEKLRRRFSMIELGPLQNSDVSQLTKLMLNTRQKLESELVSYLETKSQGNPLFLVELVRSLVTKDFLRLNHRTHLWEYDVKVIKKTKILLDSIDLTLNRVNVYDSVDRAC